MIGLRARPKGDQGGNEKPQQALHEEEHKSPEAESFYPRSRFHLWVEILTFWHCAQK